MRKFHTNREGDSGSCKAEISCPFGDLEKDHYSSRKEASIAYEHKMSELNISTMRKPQLTGFDEESHDRTYRKIDPLKNKHRPADLSYYSETYQQEINRSNQKGCKNIELHGQGMLDENSNIILKRLNTAIENNPKKNWDLVDKTLQMQAILDFYMKRGLDNPSPEDSVKLLNEKIVERFKEVSQLNKQKRTESVVEKIMEQTNRHNGLLLLRNQIISVDPSNYYGS